MAREDWSRDELRASVAVYLEMQDRLQRGLPFVKKRYYEQLAQKFGRKASAFEMRMMNISHVMEAMGRKFLPGLVPRANVGANVTPIIEALILELDDQSVSRAVLQPARQAAVPARPVETSSRPLPRPVGARVPASEMASVRQFKRDPQVIAWVLEQANGRCECCGREAPFTGADGLPFLEVHHLRRLASGGSDTVENAIAACPNCHRELHYGKNANALAKGVYARIPRLVAE